MMKSINIIFQISAVFIGTIVGAGLASGQEITQFFTSFGYKSFLGLIICMIMYVFYSFMIINLSKKFNLNSYKDLIKLVSKGFLGDITDILTSFFMVSGAAIILAGSGALLHQYFGISKWIGILFMSFISLLILFRNTKGLVEINSFIVPSLLIVITTIFILYIFFSGHAISMHHIKSISYTKNYWFLSALIYASFNTLSFSGVLVPFSHDIKNKKCLIIGTTLGALILTILSIMINFMLITNVPYIFNYDIPLLYISNRFGKILQILLLAIIWLEMFSTEVSDIYSVSKTLQQSFKISYNKAVIFIILLSLPISQIGFKKLINFLYPAFGIISFIFLVQCILFYRKNY